MKNIEHCLSLSSIYQFKILRLNPLIILSNFDKNMTSIGLILILCSLFVFIQLDFEHYPDLA